MTRARELADSADKDFAGTVTVDNIVVDTDLQFATGATVTTILDEDAMGSDSATALSTQQAIKAYVDTQVATVPTGDITEVTAGTGLTGGGTTGAVTLNIDSTVATLTGSTFTGDVTVPNLITAGNVDGRDVSVDGTKLDGIETGADVTDTANVTAAGALMTTGGSVTGDVSFGDNDKAIFGDGSDLQIYHDGSHSYIRDEGTGNLQVTTNSRILFQKNPYEPIALFDADGAVILYHDNSAKLSTTSTGIDVTGEVQGDSLDIDGVADFTGKTTHRGGVALLDNDVLSLGTSDDLKIYHDGSNSFINDVGTGNLRIGADTNVSITNSTNSTNYAVFNDSSAVKLYHGGSKKFETTSYGIDISGSVVADTQTVTLGAGTYAPNMSSFQNFVWTILGNITLGNINTEKTGQSGFFIFIHSGAGRTVSLDTDWETAGGAGLTLSSTAGAVDIVPYVVQATDNILLGTPQLAFS